MGTENIPSRSAGQIINETFFNILKSVLAIDHVPRNASGVPQAVAGSLGSSTYPWFKIFMGLAASGISIEEESAGVLIIKIGGVAMFRTSSAGVDGTLFKNLSIPDGALATLGHFKYQTFNASGNWVAPASVTQCMIWGWGGGGGGQGGDSGPLGGAGGAGAAPGWSVNGVTPGATYAVVIGAGGAAGATSGGAGGDGGQSSFDSSIRTGGKGGAASVGGLALPGGASGGNADNAGLSLVKSAGIYLPTFPGGAVGTRSGGGGAGPAGKGGDGGFNTGNAGVSGGFSFANSGAGGGGGGGNTDVGGTGGNGQITVFWS